MIDGTRGVERMYVPVEQGTASASKPRMIFTGQGVEPSVYESLSLRLDDPQAAEAERLGAGRLISVSTDQAVLRINLTDNVDVPTSMIVRLVRPPTREELFTVSYMISTADLTPALEARLVEKLQRAELIDAASSR
jgi:hypothetical protein